MPTYDSNGNQLPDVGVISINEILGSFTVAASNLRFTSPNSGAEPEETETTNLCQHCGGSSLSNNHVRRYESTYLTYINLHTRCYNADYAHCVECGAIRTHAQLEANDGFCSDHRVRCMECGDRFGHLDTGYCEGCGWMCEGCEVIYGDHVDHFTEDWDSEDHYCRSCYESRQEEDEDEDDAGHGPGIRNYGRTRASRWWGGPLPRDEEGKRLGFYLGFELEIYAERNATAVHRWAKANGLEGFFDCKYDGSVEGFEIATLPFTPEFFEGLVNDGRLASFFDMLNDSYPLDSYLGGEEPSTHGLHVHVGKIAFGGSKSAIASFSYLLGQDEGKHLERIARRGPTEYCGRVTKPVSAAVAHANNSGVQGQRAYRAGHYPGRNAINLLNDATIEIRAFRSTRSPEELAAAVRMVYVGAEYIRYLRESVALSGTDPKRLAWSEFCRWSAFAHPQAFASLANLDEVKAVRSPRPTPHPVVEDQFSYDETVAVTAPARSGYREVMQEPVSTMPRCGEPTCTSEACRPRAEVRLEPRGLAAVFPPLPEPAMASANNPF